ncbi:MAG TPA: serine/threonine-protein kinase, partial [Isosphaeraceae bacterium]|nr:serine/threonine-protein kinase [Isosphaeraceae bacterium]
GTATVLSVSSPPVNDALSETIPYQRDEAADHLDLGFPATDELLDRFLGQYRIGAVIGRGSMGRVYRGEHRALGRTSAIKVISPRLVSKQPQMLERFWAEARALAGLVHPHIVAVYNVGSDRGFREVVKKWGKHNRRVREYTENTYHYIEMEYVPRGISLKEILVREGALRPDRATLFVYQVVQALGAAHRAGLVHRDIKPANVLMAADGRAKLADFGLVRGTTAEELAGATIAGTPTFMAPELFQGSPASFSSDFYALGVMYYYLLTARLPFAADRLADIVQLHQTAPVPDAREIVPELPDVVTEILTRALAKEQSERYLSAEEFLEDLQAAFSQLRDIESLVREALEGLDGAEEVSTKEWRIVLKVPGDRVQEVRIEVSQGRMQRQLLSVYSVCCAADPSHYEFALKLNAELTYGGLSIHTVDGRAMFVMTRTYPGGNVSPEEIRAAVHEIARRSDWVEQQLTRADVY